MKDKIVTLELTVEEVNIILASMAKMPFEAVADLITKVQREGSRQLSPQDIPDEAA
jgi:hypothetical protein